MTCQRLLILMFITVILCTLGSEVGLALEPPEEEWNATFGGTADEIAYSVQQTTDGGYILAGKTRSFGAGGDDAWLVKTDSNGNKQWDKTFGGTKYDMAYSVQQTSDGGYIIAGQTRSYSDSKDFWLVKTDSNGNKQWGKTFGGDEWESAHSVQQTTDGGYIIAGQTGLHDSADVWLVKTDSSGNMQWDRTLDGGARFNEQSVQQTPDGGYIFAGPTTSFNSIDDDFWLIKFDSEGNKEWDRIFIKNGRQFASSVACTIDGGYIIVGSSSTLNGPGNIWIVKTDNEGNRQWDHTYGKRSYDIARSIQQTVDGGYIIAGSVGTWLNGARGYPDSLLIKTDSNGIEQWNMTFELNEQYSEAYLVEQTIDGGYIIVGKSKNYNDGVQNMLLIKLKGQNIVSPPSNEDNDSDDKENANSLLFHTSDFKDFPSFAIKLKYSQDPLSIYLCEHLSVSTLELLNEYNDQGQPSEALQRALEADLNQILQSGSLYDEQRFENIELSDDILKLIEDNPQGQDLILLNRMLLEEAYPQEIEKHKQKEDRKVPGFTFMMQLFASIFAILIRRKCQ